MDGGDEGGGFVFTSDMDYRAQVASIAACSFSLFLSVFICLASAWIYSVPSARHHLDRVSFRLLLWSMGVEVLYCSVYLYIFSDPLTRTYYPTSCGATVYLMVATMGTANWLCTFIGVNLMLAICFGINPVRARLERWYIGISFLLGFGISLIPAGMGDFGVDNRYGACYFTEMDETERIKDFILDLYLWQILSCFVAAASVLAVLITLLRQSRATGRALFRANGLNITSQELRSITLLSESSSSSPLSPTTTSSSRLFWPLPLLQRARDRKASSLHRLEDKFITIAIKISLYPLALIIINAFITAEDLDYTIGGGVASEGDYVLYCIYYFLYGGRGMFFALLGIFVDPCLRRGLPAAWTATFHSSRPYPPNFDTSAPTQMASQGEDVEKGDIIGVEADASDQSLSDFLSSQIPPTESRGSEGWETGKTASTKRRLGLRLWGRTESSSACLEEGRSRDTMVEEGNGAPMTLDLSVQIVDPDRPATPSFTSPPPASTTHALPPSTLSTHPPHLPQTTHAPHPAPPPAHPAHIPPTRPPPAPRTNSQSSQNRSNWIQPLASAILTPPDPTLPRRSSDPALGNADRRRRELRAAAEKMYADVQAQL